MAAHAGDRPEHLAAALDSLAGQTRPADEVVLVEDGPLPDALREIIEAYRPRLPIVSVPLERNVGLASALNAGLARCSHELVARMDSDDVCRPERFERQLSFMVAEPDLAASSAWVQEFDDRQEHEGPVRRLPQGGDALAAFARHRSPLNHPAAVLRRSAVEAVGGYPVFSRGQDYALWSLLLVHGYHLANIPEVLLDMRADGSMMARRGLRALAPELAMVRFQYRIGFLSLPDYLLNSSLRAFLRLSPAALRRMLYAARP